MDQEKGVGNYVKVGAGGCCMGGLVGHGKNLDLVVLMVVESHWEIYSMKEIQFDLF